MRVLVCGGRDYEKEMEDRGYNAQGVLFNTLHEHVSLEADTIISGLARGVDTFAAEYARIHMMPMYGFPADWKKHGKKAGYMRNARMLYEGKPDKVIAFPGGKGTAMMVDLARTEGVEVIEIGYP